MAFETVLGNLMHKETVDANKILSELIDGKNINLKTHITEPITFALLDTLINFSDDLLFKNITKKFTTKFFSYFLQKLKEYLYSWNRLSRKEITDVLKALKEQEMSERSLFSRLTGFTGEK